MKRIVLLVTVLAFACASASAQGMLGRLKERAKEAVESNIGNKVEEGINSVFNKNKNQNQEAAKPANPQEAAEGEEAVGETVDFAAIQAKSDFKRGGTVFFNDELKGEQLGEFPSKWDLLSGSEVVNIKGVNAIKMEGGRIQPLMEEKYYLPEEFTIEFDVLSQPAQEGSGWDATLNIVLKAEEGADAFDIRTSVETHTLNNPSGGYYGIGWGWGARNPNDDTIDGEPGTATIARVFKKNNWNHIAISFNKRAFKMYLNYERIVNIPNMKQPRSWYMEGYSDSKKGVYVTNIVMAKGAVELYDRNATDYSSAVEKAIVETGKFVTNNILFETGKATLKPESMEEIQKVADYMKKNPSARFEVQGHTDNSGSDKVNDPLSQERAEAVVKALEGLGVDPFNLRPVGKGSHEPVADNGTEAGRAQNRRVEFIKK